MAEDVYPDGGHSELTPGYHAWVMERFLKVALLCRANGYEVPACSIATSGCSNS